MFQEEYEQLKTDRDTLRFDILKNFNESALPMPVNIPRLIQNIK